MGPQNKLDTEILGLAVTCIQISETLCKEIDDLRPTKRRQIVAKAAKAIFVKGSEIKALEGRLKYLQQSLQVGMLTRLDGSLQDHINDTTVLQKEIQGLASAVSIASTIAERIKSDLLDAIAAGFNSQKLHTETQTRDLMAHSNDQTLVLTNHGKDQTRIITDHNYHQTQALKGHAEGQTQITTQHNDALALSIIHEIKEQFQKQNGIQTAQEQKGNMFQQVMSSISFAGMQDREINIAESSLGTNEWILGDFQHSDEAGDKSDWTMGKDFSSRFESWLKGTASTFWFNGKAGCGKSTLFKHIAHHSQTKKHLATWSTGEKAPVVLTFFFYSPTQEKTLLNSLDGFLRSIAFQLLDSRPGLVQVVDQVFEADSQNPFHAKSKRAYVWRRKELLDLCQRLVTEVIKEQKIAFFIDGLDEMLRESATPFLDLVRDMLRNHRVKACVSSRWEANFHAFFRHDLYELKLSELNHRDIVIAIRSRILPSLHAEFPDEDTAAFVESVAKKSEGIFLWAALVTNEIGDRLGSCGDFKSLERLLDSLPAGIEPLYAHMLRKVNREEAAMYLGPFVLEHKAPALPFTLLSLSFLLMDVKRRFLLDKAFIHADTQPGPRPRPQILRLGLGRPHSLPSSEKGDSGSLVLGKSSSSPPSGKETSTNLEILVQACETTKNRIRAFCRGLVEVTSDTPFTPSELFVYDGIYPKPTIDTLEQTLLRLARRVKFIHRSVGEYLRKHVLNIMGKNWRAQAATHLFDIYLGAILTTRAMLGTSRETSYSEMSLSMDCFAQLLSIQASYKPSKITMRHFEESYKIAQGAYEKRVLYMDLKDMLKECGHKRITKWQFSGSFMEFSAFCGQSLCLENGFQKKRDRSQDELDRLLYLSVLGLQYSLSSYEGKNFDIPDEHYDGLLRTISSALAHGGSPTAVIYENRKDYNLCFEGSIWDRFLLTIFRKYCWGNLDTSQPPPLHSETTQTLIRTIDHFLQHGIPLDSHMFLTPPSRSARDRDLGDKYTLPTQGANQHEYIIETSGTEVLGLILSVLELQDSSALPSSLKCLTKIGEVVPALRGLGGLEGEASPTFFPKFMHWIPPQVAAMAQDLTIQKVPGKPMLEIVCSEYYIQDVYEQVRAGNDLLKILSGETSTDMNPGDILFFPTPRRFEFCSEASKAVELGARKQVLEDHWAKGDMHCLLLSDPKSIKELRPPARPQQYNDLGNFHPRDMKSIIQDREGIPPHNLVPRRDSEDVWDPGSSLPPGPLPSRFERIHRGANK